MPLKSLFLWYKKFKEYVTLLKNNKKKNIEYPTIYVSKKYPKMDILELYKIIKKRLIRNFPYIYKKFKIKNKETLIQVNKNNIKECSTKKNDIKEKENRIILNNININKTNLLEDIKIINEMNCSYIKHLFESHKFSENIEKYDNCFVKSINIIKKKVKKLYSSRTKIISHSLSTKISESKSLKTNNINNN